MRNLALISSWESFLPSSSSITATTIDLDENVIYVASEHNTLDGEVQVGVWKMNQSEGSNSSPLEQISTFQTVVSLNGQSNGQIISFRFMAESRRIAAIMRGGDVIMISIEEEGAPFEVEGSFESGIFASSWSPDESVVAIVTGEHKLILLTSLFDVLSEKPLHVEDFGDDAPINVGWGSKETQFHGSLGKTAAQAPSTSKKIGISPDDDNLSRISWRGDSAFFVVSSLSPASNARSHRTLRVYDRQGLLQTTSEDVAGLEHPLVWRPSGNLIVGTQRFGFEGGGAGSEGRHDVIFFERNGLRHGEFTLRVDQIGVKDKGVNHERRWGYKVRELAWNSDSNVLAIWIEGDVGDIVQFWTTGNYHWYLKHEISAPSSSAGEPGRFTSINWHPELALQLMLTTKSQVLQRIYSWDTFISSKKPPYDSGAVAIVDGSKLLLTPFRSQNIPPPMSSYQLALSPAFSRSLSPPKPTTPVHVTFSPENDDLALLWESGYFEIWTLKMRLVPGLAKILDPTKILGSFARTEKESGIRWRQILLRSNDASGKSFTVTVLGTGPGNQSDTITVSTVEEGVSAGTTDFPLPYRNCRLVTADMCQSPNGELFTYTHQEIRTPVARFFEFCVHAYKVEIPQSEIDKPQAAYLGLAKSGKLYVSTSEEETRTMATNAISFAITPNFAIFTTNAHEAIFAPLSSLSRLFDQPNGSSKETPPEWTIRKVERGSRIVVAVPSSMSLVLQMPRGNLETINPRPLVMEVVKHDLDVGNYRKAFFACRKHRIDLNVIVDHDPEKLRQNISPFIDQIPEVDHLNLFLTLTGRGDRPPETIAILCDAFRDELEKRDLTKYVNSILTAHVVKTPPDHEAGLALLLRLRDSNPDIVEDAVKYIIFLVDADRLFDTALGMYDFSLVLMIAQHAQKDPREYLPFLRELRALDKYYQRFKIDDHLKRYQSALKNLSLAGPERFDEAVEYVERHQLYEYGLSIWKGTDHYEDILNSYGDWLFERREFRQAAAVFVEAKRTRKAMIAHEKALEWQELFNLAVLDEKMDEEDIVDMGYRVAEDLSSKKRHAEAARVLLDYCKDLRESVIALVQGNGFSEARRIISLNSAPELVEDVIHPALLESRGQITEDITEMKEQIRKQLVRLRELRIKKIEEPDVFYGDEDEIGMHNVDVMTDVSAPATAFTRYTVAPTSASRTSKRSSRSKRKMERKVGSGRKGTVDEEEYLLRSITKLVDRFLMTQAETKSLLPHLLQFTAEHREEGLGLQKEVEAFEVELKDCVEEIWTRPVEENEVGGASVPDGWASRMAEVERSRVLNPLDKVAKPDLLQGKDWRVWPLTF